MTSDEIENLELKYISCLQSDRQKTFEINVLVPENRELRAENDRLKIAGARYEYLRCLKPSQFALLFQANLDGEGAFDDLVDRRRI